MYVEPDAHLGFGILHLSVEIGCEALEVIKSILTIQHSNIVPCRQILHVSDRR